MPAPLGYNRTQIALHWIVAALIIPQFVFHDAISEALAAFNEGRAVPFNPAVPMHVLAGMLICVMVIWRIVLRIRRGAPAPVPSANPMMTKVASGVQHTMYLVLLIMAVSGSAAWFAGVAPAAQVHGALKFVLMLLVLIHVAGALKQQFVEKTGVIGRMMKAAD